MATLVTVIHVFVCLFLVMTVLLQPGKGGGMGGAFGGGSTQGVFGGSGGSSMLRKATVFIAALFMLSSMTLAWLASNTGADALKQFSAAERQRHEHRESLRQSVLEGADDGTPLLDEGALGDDAPMAPPEEDLTPEQLEELLEGAMREADEAEAAEADEAPDTAAPDDVAESSTAQPVPVAPQADVEAEASDTAADEMATGEDDTSADDVATDEAAAP